MVRLGDEQQRQLDLAQAIMALIAERHGGSMPGGLVNVDANIAFNALATVIAHLLDGYDPAKRARALAVFVESLGKPEERIPVAPRGRVH